MSAVRWRDLLGRRFDTPDQGLMTAWVSQRGGAALAAVGFLVHLSPNAVTVIGLLCMLTASAGFAFLETTAGWIGAGLLWQFGFALDCADGQLARATGRTSERGGWLDVACDYIRQAAVTLAILYALLEGRMRPEVAFTTALVLQAGLSVHLHTVGVVKPKGRTGTGGGVGGGRKVLRKLVQSILDTPLFLAVLCALRPYPLALAGYAGGFGLLVLLRALALGWIRLRPS